MGVRYVNCSKMAMAGRHAWNTNAGRRYRAMRLSQRHHCRCLVYHVTATDGSDADAREFSFLSNQAEHTESCVKRMLVPGCTCITATLQALCIGPCPAEPTLSPLAQRQTCILPRISTLSLLHCQSKSHSLLLHAALAASCQASAYFMLQSPTSKCTTHLCTKR